ncbi:MAG: NusG domain II-containing protein [Firmicutes bacterium]|nr:NusG domain II-containing protein [Bacillota bacterium]
MFFKKGDILIIIAVISVSMAFYFLYNRYANNGSVCAEIYYYSQLVDKVRLDNNETTHTFSVSQNEKVVFEISGGGIRFIQSDCPDKICIKSGWLSKPGQSAACLPNGIIIKIVSANKNGRQPDATSGQ